MSLADLYREHRQAERFLKLEAVQIRANINRYLFYEYHNGFGHRMEDCYDLLDAM